MKRWQGSNLTSRLLAAVSSFHIFKSRTCRGIKGSQSHSSGSSLPLRPHHRCCFYQHRIIHGRQMPLVDKSPCATPPPRPVFNTNKHSDPHLWMPLLQVSALHQKVLRLPGDSSLLPPHHHHHHLLLTGGRWLMRGDKATPLNIKYHLSPGTTLMRRKWHESRCTASPESRCSVCQRGWEFCTERKNKAAFMFIIQQKRKIKNMYIWLTFCGRQLQSFIFN